MSLQFWQLRRLLGQRGVPATAVLVLGLLAGLLGYTAPGAVLAAGGAYALVLPALVTPRDPTA